MTSTFHVRHDFNPVVARDALLILRLPNIVSEEDFLQCARDRDFEIGRRQSAAKVFASLRDLGFLTRPINERQGTIRLTSLGSQLADIAIRDEFLLAELIHLRYWWLWTPEFDGDKFSWAYQTLANTLWDESPIAIDSNHLVSVISSKAEEQFGAKGISFSSSSVLGVLHWLRALRPPCILDGEFRRRPSCAPEGLIVALEGIYNVLQRPLGIPLRLDASIRDRICRAVLLEPAAFDEVLHQAEESLGLIWRQGDGGEMVMLRESLFPKLILERH